MLAERYQVLERIGRGGVAEVLRAHDLLLGRDVAVKVFRTRVDESDPLGGRARQEAELQALARLNHPNLITLFDGSMGAGGEPAFLVMEFVDGPTLAALIGDEPLPEPQARLIGHQIADALSYVHAHQMVHRDVKPANVLVGRDNFGRVRARLSDFGIVRLLGSERLTEVDFTVGTASYLAPEQARGSDVGPPADVYSLGLVLLESLTGEPAFTGSAIDMMAARLHSTPEVPDDLPAPWPRLLRGMLATAPGARPAAAQVSDLLRGGPGEAATAAALGATAVTTASDAPPATVSHRDPDRRRAPRVGPWLASAAVLVVLVVAALLIWQPWTSDQHSGKPQPVSTTGRSSSPPPARETTGRQSRPVVGVPADSGGPSRASSPAGASTGASAGGSRTSPLPTPSASGSTPTSTTPTESSSPTATSTTSPSGGDETTTATPTTPTTPTTPPEPPAQP